jgi:hypothetical protein
VWFTTGIKELWSTSGYKSYRVLYLPPEPFYGPPVPIRYQFMVPPLGPEIEQYKKLFLLRYDDWCAGSFWEQRLSIQRLIKQLLAEGWSQPEYPKSVLLQDYQKLLQMDLEKYLRKDILNNLNHIEAGRTLIEQFTNTLSMQKFWEPCWLYRAIRRCLRAKRNVTRHSMMMAMNRQTRHIFTGRYCSPHYYRLLFKRFDLSEMTFLDVYPNGSKAIAATLERLQYHAIEPYTELARFLGTEFSAADNSHYDVLWIDNQERRSVLEVNVELEKWYDKADIKIIHVRHNQQHLMPKPDRVVPTRDLIWDKDKKDFYYYYV